jgi:predicted permease
LLTEGLVLVSLGAGVGLLFARWGASVLVAMLAGPAELLVLEPHFDLRVLAFTTSVSIATALLFSLAPSLRATNVDAAKPGTVVRSTSQNRLGPALVVVQVTLSVLLLCGAALLVRTLHNLNGVETGFAAGAILAMQVEATVPTRTVKPKTPEEFRADHSRLGGMWRGFMDRVHQVPGVSSAGMASGMSPLSGLIRGVSIRIDGLAAGPEKNRGVRLNHVTDGYFETLGIRILAGRSFTPQDQPASLRVAILNETAARTFFATDSPLGRKLNFPGQRVQDQYEIVGIVADARYQDLRTADEPMVYVPVEQAIDPITSGVLYVRGAGDALLLVPSLRASVAETLPGGLLSGIVTIGQQVEMSLVRERMLAFLATFFAALALLLACVGLYGVVAYRIVRRTREIGIRLALGAKQQSVVWMMVRETVLLVAIGATLGTLASLAVNRFIAAQLFAVTTHDPIAIAVALSVLGSVTLMAGYLPARRASRIDPVTALRAE